MSGTEALARAAELTPDVVLVDLDLDGESGFDVAVELAQCLLRHHPDLHARAGRRPGAGRRQSGARLSAQVGAAGAGDQGVAGRRREGPAHLKWRGRRPAGSAPSFGDRCCRDLVNTLQCGGTRGGNDGVRM
ncbi:hypothetical protein ACIRJM_21860 [Streptomyces sp. NPDC102405]|uniref:hypothetical protein n=1 Tax=Streptomyces sp. NPDC102405 TaxID=3366170 RepID=UPI0037FB2562